MKRTCMLLSVEEIRVQRLKYNDWSTPTETLPSIQLFASAYLLHRNFFVLLSFVGLLAQTFVTKQKFILTKILLRWMLALENSSKFKRSTSTEVSGGVGFGGYFDHKKLASKSIRTTTTDGFRWHRF